jgi:hypothetical protein
VSVVVPVALFIWLLGNKGLLNDRSNAHALTKPFLPMRKFPLRYWFTVSLMLIPASAIASLNGLFMHRKILPVDAMLFFVGALILCAVAMHAKVCWPLKRK